MCVCVCVCVYTWVDGKRIHALQRGRRRADTSQPNRTGACRDVLPVLKRIRYLRQWVTDDRGELQSLFESDSQLIDRELLHRPPLSLPCFSFLSDLFLSLSRSFGSLNVFWRIN